MKRKFWWIIYLLIIFIFCTYLVFANYLFNVILHTGDEAYPIRRKITPLTGDVNYRIETSKFRKVKWKETLLLEGWAFTGDREKEEREIFIVFKSENDTIVFPITHDEIKRPDVAEYWQLDNGIDSYGFSVDVPKYFLRDRTYQIGFVIVNDKGSHCSLFKTKIVFDGGKILIQDDEPKRMKPVEYVFHDEHVSVQSTTDPPKFNIESVSKTGMHVTVKGWSYLNGFNADGIKINVLMKRMNKIHVFRANSEIRKDVSEHFKEFGLNLDQSGFEIQIPTALLKNGKYRVGLLLEKGNEVGIGYSDKYVMIY